VVDSELGIDTMRFHGLFNGCQSGLPAMDATPPDQLPLRTVSIAQPQLRARLGQGCRRQFRKEPRVRMSDESRPAVEILVEQVDAERPTVFFKQLGGEASDNSPTNVEGLPPAAPLSKQAVQRSFVLRNKTRWLPVSSGSNCRSASARGRLTGVTLTIAESFFASAHMRC
jgi:hypothetical protein